jgi:hypothetical protein
VTAHLDAKLAIRRSGIGLAAYVHLAGAIIVAPASTLLVLTFEYWPA